MIETSRLILREFILDDSKFLLKLLNTPSWLKFIGDRNVKTNEQAQTFISDKLIKSYRTLGFGLYLIEKKDNHAPIGMCGLVKRDGLDDIDLGFALLPEYEGMGYGYEAAEATLKYAKNILNISRIVAITNTSNLNSIKLLNKLGLKFEKMVTMPNGEELMLFG